MIKPEIPANDKERIAALMSYSLLDTLPEKEFDDITMLASYICQTPISLISLVDEKRQWFKSRRGVNASETPRDVSFCAHAINRQDEVMIVPDSRLDERFSDNPLVNGYPNVVFYAGIPLVNPDGYVLGTLCVIDSHPKQISKEQIEALRALSNQLVKLFELRRSAILLNHSVYELKLRNKGLDDFVRVAAHDIKSPLGNIMMLTELLKHNYSDKLDDEGGEIIDHVHRSSRRLIDLVDGILQYSKDVSQIMGNRESVNVKAVVDTVVDLIESCENVKFVLEIIDDCVIYTNRIALEQIFVNLVSNSIKYSDKPQTIVTIKVTDEDGFIRCNVIDNGPGINDSDKERIFNLFETASMADRKGTRGTGIGLATVKSLVEGLGGKITVYSVLGHGADFEFFLKK